MIGASGSPAANNMVITLGIFLKLLGFFVVMYSYADMDPGKVSKAELSLKQRFNISLTIPTVKTGMESMTMNPVQNIGRSYTAIEADLKTQMDIFSSEQIAHSKELVLQLPADQILDLGERGAKSPGFSKLLKDTLIANEPKNYQYHIRIVGINGDSDQMMRGLGDFVQSLIANGYPQNLLTIGYLSKKDSDAKVQFRIEAVPK